MFHGKQFFAIDSVGANVAPAPLGWEQMGRTVTVRFPDHHQLFQIGGSERVLSIEAGANQLDAAAR